MKIKNLLVMSTVLACGLTLASCQDPVDSTGSNGSTPSTPETSDVTVGLGYTYSYELNAADEEKGTAAYCQVDYTVAFAAFDADGKIVDARVDVVQIKGEINEDNTLTVKGGTILDEAGSIKSKLELGKDYNMVTFGGAIAEVDAQIEAFCDWTVGQTVAEVKANINPDVEHGVAANEELEGLVTIGCNDFVAALESAWANKTTETYSGVGTAGIALVSGLSLSYGNYELTADVAGVWANEDKVVVAQIDALVLQVSTADGAIAQVADQKYLDGDKLLSKKTLGTDYAMVGSSPIGAEWYEQAASFEAAVAGLTNSEIVALVAGEGDLDGAVTISIEGYTSAVAKALNYASLEHVGPQA